jgi:hypothetical protein
MEETKSAWLIGKRGKLGLVFSQQCLLGPCSANIEFLKICFLEEP